MFNRDKLNKPTHSMNSIVLLTFDVEDWFQVENFKECIPFSTWSSYELRVEKNTYRILDLLDSFNPQSKIHHLQQKTNYESSTISYQPDGPSKLKTTFFILGWVAERLPNLVREIHSRGHEVASHGYYHNLCNQETKKELKKDLIDSKKLLEDIIGFPVHGYRAPSFSVNNEILKIIEDCGYLFDSSFNSFGMNKRYGKIDLIQNGKMGIAYRISDNFYEIPISNINFFNLVLAWGGGGFFRLIPLSLFKLGAYSILKRENTYLFFLHPWEIDPEQPKVSKASAFYKFRHYHNLRKNYSRLSKLLEHFQQCHFLSCYQYLKLKTREGQEKLE